MNKLRLLILAAFLPLSAGAPAPATAQTSVPVGHFDALELRGGGSVVIRRGERHRVTLIRGNLETTAVELDTARGNERSLVIRACRTSCRDYDLRIEIVTPDIDAVAITGGGAVRVEPGFARQGNLALAVIGGGAIDATALPASNVAASVRGGGSIRTAPTAALAASVSGGGAILYSGNPQVVTSVHGGGAVTRAR